MFKFSEKKEPESPLFYFHRKENEPESPLFYFHRKENEPECPLALYIPNLSPHTILLVLFSELANVGYVTCTYVIVLQCPHILSSGTTDLLDIYILIVYLYFLE